MILSQRQAQEDLSSHFLVWSTIKGEIISLQRTTIFPPDLHKRDQFHSAGITPQRRLSCFTPAMRFRQIGDLNLHFRSQILELRLYCSKFDLAILKTLFFFFLIFLYELCITTSSLHNLSQFLIHSLPSTVSALRVH